MFEPTRLLNDPLVDAYTQLVPLRPRQCRRVPRLVKGTDTAGVIWGSLAREQRL